MLGLRILFSICSTLQGEAFCFGQRRPGQIGQGTRLTAGPLRPYVGTKPTAAQETSKAIITNIEMQMANNVVRSGTKLAMLNTVKKDEKKGSKAGSIHKTIQR